MAGRPCMPERGDRLSDVREAQDRKNGERRHLDQQEDTGDPGVGANLHAADDRGCDDDHDAHPVAPERPPQHAQVGPDARSDDGDDEHAAHDAENEECKARRLSQGPGHECVLTACDRKSARKLRVAERHRDPHDCRYSHRQSGRAPHGDDHRRDDDEDARGRRHRGERDEDVLAKRQGAREILLVLAGCARFDAKVRGRCRRPRSGDCASSLSHRCP